MNKKNKPTIIINRVLNNNINKIQDIQKKKRLHFNQYFFPKYMYPRIRIIII